MKVRKTGADDYGKHIKALIFGEPGSGKTLISSTFPNPLYASAEGGLMSIADRNMPYVEVTSTDDLLDIKNAISQEPAVREQLLGFPVDTIIIDTIDEVQKIMKQERLKATNSKSLGLQDWGWLAEQMTAFIRGFRNIPIHVVFTCHIKEVNDGENGRIHYKPDLQGSIADSIAGYVDLSLLLDANLVSETVNNKLVKVERRTLVTAPSLAFPFLKDRSGKLPFEVPVNFEDDFQRINDYIFGSTVELRESVEYEVEAPGKTEEEIAVEEIAEAIGDIVKVSETKPEPVKVDQPAEATKEKKVQAVTSDGVKSKNMLPEGVVPKSQGFNTEVFCTVCGDEVEDEATVDKSRIRFRRILDGKCYDQELNKKKENK